MDEKAYKYISLNILLNTFCLLINAAINLFLIPFITEKMGVEAYGYISLANNFTSYFEVIATALNALAARYIAVAYHQHDIRKANGYFSSILFANVILSVVIMIPSCFAIYFLQNIINIPLNLVKDIKILFLLVLINYAINLIMTAFQVATFIKNKLYKDSLDNLVVSLCKAVLLFSLFTLFSIHVWYVSIAAVISSLYLLIRKIYYKKTLTKELTISLEQVSVSYIKEILSKGIWSSLSNLGSVLNTGIDLLITNLLLTPTAMGELSIIKSISTLITQLLASITTAFRTKQLEAYAKNDISSLIKQFNFSMKICSFFAIMFISIFGAYGDEFLGLFVPSQNTNHIYTIAMIVLLGDILVDVVRPLFYIFTLTAKVRLPSLINLLNGVVNLISMYLLLKFTSLELYAVVLTTAVCNFIVNLIVTPIISSRYINVSIRTFYPVIIRHCIVAFFSTFILEQVSHIIFTPSTWIGLFICCAISLIIMCIFLSFAVFNQQERKKIIILVKKYVNKKKKNI